MPRLQVQEAARTRIHIPVPRARYVIVHDGRAWMIKFDGEEYGPYMSEREALLFAIEAAYKLGQHGEEAEVLVAEAAGMIRPVWTYGQDRFPADL
jgi:hypothetical protein